MTHILQTIAEKLNRKISRILLTVCLTINLLTAFAQVPDGPTDFRAIQVGNTIELHWTDNADNETGFVIQKEWDDIYPNNIQISLPSNTVHYVDTEVQPNTNYYYYIWAENASGASNEEYVVGIVNTVAPPAPENVSVIAGPLMSLEITFTDNSDLETYFEIHHTNNPDEYYGLETVTGGTLNSVVTHYISDGPYNPYQQPPPDEVYYEPGTLVYVKIRAVINDNGSLTYGPFSPVVTALTNPVPATPTNFVASTEGTNVHLTWTDNSISEAAYFLARFEGEFNSAIIKFIQLPPDATEYTDPDVLSNIEYHYWLIALDVVEYTVWPPWFWNVLFTFDDSRVAKTSVMILELPPAPTDVTATAISPTSILVTFTDISDIEYWYELLITTTPDESTAIALLEGWSPETGTLVEIEVPDLSPNTTYYFRVRGAFEPYGNLMYGPYSAVIAATTPGEPSLVPEPPVAKPATAVMAKSFVANWNAAPGATYYELDVFDNKDHSYVPGYQGKVVYGTSATVVIKKKSAHHYSYVLRSVNESGMSENSNTIPIGKIKSASLAGGKIANDDIGEDGMLVHLYPNPVTDIFKILITSPHEAVAELQIINQHGISILTRNVPTNELIELEASPYPQGMYFLRVLIGRSFRVIKVIKG